MGIIYFTVNLLALLLPGFLTSFLVFKFIKLNDNLKYIICFASLAILITMIYKFSPENYKMAIRCSSGFLVLFSLVSIPLGRDLAKRLNKK